MTVAIITLVFLRAHNIQTVKILHTWRVSAESFSSQRALIRFELYSTGHNCVTDFLYENSSLLRHRLVCYKGYFATSKLATKYYSFITHGSCRILTTSLYWLASWFKGESSCGEMTVNCLFT